MSFNVSALDTFRNANLGGQDAIANLGQGDKIVKKNDYHGAIGAMFRGKETKAANNAVRTELLRSLGNAFGLEGVGRDDKGVTTFSEAFIDKLAKLIGPAFKREDFGIDKNGIVTSGKPLTQRRITAIIKEATLVGRGDYDHATYKARLDYVTGKLAAMKVPNTMIYAKEAAIRHFEKVAKLMDFAKNDLPDLISDNIFYDPKSADDDDASAEVRSKYVLNNRLNGNVKEEPLTSISMVTNYLSDSVSELFHIQENILAGEKNMAHFSDLKDPKQQITDYLTRTIQAFVSTSLDAFIDAEKAGKTEAYLSYLGGTWPCVEGKTTGITEFRLTTCPPDDTGPVATHDKDQPLNQCIGREIAAIMQSNPNAQEWKDVAAQVKTNLVGVIRPIDVPEMHVTKLNDGEELTTYEFKPLLGETGKPVVRAITEADIDALGEAVMDTILFG